MSCKRAALRELQADAAVARELARRRKDEIAGAGEAEERFGRAAERHAEASHLGEAPRDERRARVQTRAPGRRKCPRRWP
jgi:hypothetical protein